MLNIKILLRLFSVFAFLLSAGCATNLTEMRSARVLKGGEIQVTDSNNIIIPSAVVENAIDPARTLVDKAESGDDFTDEEKADLMAASAAIALTGPGYSNHIELGVGLGYHTDIAFRLSNGIYGLALRHGTEIGKWDAAIGIRAAKNSGASLIPYLDSLNSYAKLSGLERIDRQLFVQMSREFGEVAKFWIGGKYMSSPFEGEIDATKMDLGTQKFSGDMTYMGGFIGGGLGFRWFHFIAELMVMKSEGSTELYGKTYDLSGIVIAPSWGFQGTF